MVKTNKKCTFVEWCPTESTVGLNERPPALIEDGIGAAVRNVTMIGNNSGISRVLCILKSICEGMEEGELQKQDKI